MLALIDDLSVWQALLLVGALGVVFAFEFVNGFHDTANAVATVIYTNSLRPWTAVIWSGFCNFCGVYLGGVAVAFSIVHLLPVDLLVGINTSSGLAMVFALLLSAIVWNFGTWYLGLPASSSHALIGSILGVGLANGLLVGRPFGAGVNWGKAQEVGLALLLSPVIGFCLAALLLVIASRIIRSPTLYNPPPPGERPPWWIRAILIVTCTGVSAAHGSNDGQKGVGMVMLILIGILPASFALNAAYSPQQITEVVRAAEEVDQIVGTGSKSEGEDEPHSARIQRLLGDRTSFSQLPPNDRWELRTAILRIDTELRGHVARETRPEVRQKLESLRRRVLAPTEYAPTWVILCVALALGVGTCIGWQRIVITVGEKIGKSHLTYAQGAAAELVAMTTIGLGDFAGLPLSTTHVLSSAVAGTMAASHAGVQMASIKKILLAWVLTLPATMLMSGSLLALFWWLIPT